MKLGELLSVMDERSGLQMTVSKFKVGDRVYAPFRGYGTLVDIIKEDADYPIQVKWDDPVHGEYNEPINSFTEKGYSGNMTALIMTLRFM